MNWFFWFFITWPFVGALFSFIFVWMNYKLNYICPRPSAEPLTVGNLFWGMFCGWLTVIWVIVWCVLYIIVNKVNFNYVVYDPARRKK